MHRRSGKVKRIKDELGASLVEYALLLALIAVVCITAVTFFGKASGSSIDNSGSCIEAAAAGQPLPATCP